MRGLIAFLLVFLGYSDAIAQVWPTLPNTGFISGRSATLDDIADGNAIFVAKLGDVPSGVPLKIVIPQYAYLIAESGKKTPVIVVQAEEANGVTMIGVRDFEGNGHIATEAEFQFLGAKPPD